MGYASGIYHVLSAWPRLAVLLLQSSLFFVQRGDSSLCNTPMNFLKSAVASAIAQGPPFPYNFGDIVDIDESIWTLYNGTKRVLYPTHNRLSPGPC